MIDTLNLSITGQTNIVFKEIIVFALSALSKNSKMFGITSKHRAYFFVNCSKIKHDLP